MFACFHFAADFVHIDVNLFGAKHNAGLLCGLFWFQFLDMRFYIYQTDEHYKGVSCVFINQSSGSFS
jgi:hypothetical protein